MDISTLTTKGQTTIPAAIRKRLNLQAGDKLQYLLEGERIVLVPAKRSIKELKGIVPKPAKPVSLEEMDAAVAEESAGRMNQ